MDNPIEQRSLAGQKVSKFNENYNPTYPGSSMKSKNTHRVKKTIPAWLSNEIYYKSMRSVKWVYQGWRIKDQHTKINSFLYTAAAAAKSLQSCPTLCDPIDGISPGSLVPGILQARTLEWVAISFSSAWKWKVKVKSLSRVRLCATPWTAAHQAPPSMGFSRQDYWSGVPLQSESFRQPLK